MQSGVLYLSTADILIECLMLRDNLLSLSVDFFASGYCGLGFTSLCGVAFILFLRATAGTAVARLSHRNSVCPSVRLSVTRVDQAKTVQARIIKSSPSAAPKTVVSGSVTLFQKFNRGHPNRGPEMRGG